MEIDRSDRNDRYVILNLEMPVLSGTKYRQIQHETWHGKYKRAPLGRSIFRANVVSGDINSHTVRHKAIENHISVGNLAANPDVCWGASQAGLALARVCYF